MAAPPVSVPTRTERAAVEDAPPGAAVRLEAVTRVYDGRIRALDGVSLSVNPGEFVVVTGPSGCGKSTLLNLVGGLDAPDAGTVLVDGRDVAAVSAPAFRRHVTGFVFQLHHLLPALSAEENVEVPMIAAGVERGARRRRARELLAEVGLGERATDVPSRLSGGERQRVAIARALANDPRLLLADEPTGALDSATGARVLELLDGVRRRRGMTVIMVSYDPAIGARADRLVRMRDGRVVSGGEPGSTAGQSRP